MGLIIRRMRHITALMKLTYGRWKFNEYLFIYHLYV